MCVDKDFNVFGSVLLTHKPGLNDKRLLNK